MYLEPLSRQVGRHLFNDTVRIHCCGSFYVFANEDSLLRFGHAYTVGLRGYELHERLGTERQHVVSHPRTPFLP